MECKHNWIHQMATNGPRYFFSCTRCGQWRFAELTQKEKALTL